MKATSRIRAAAAAVSLSLLSASARAEANFDAVTAFLQKFAEFMAGPFGKGVVIISIIAAFCTWVFAPKDGIFGPVLRVVVAGIAILNAATWMGQLGAGGGVNLGG